MKFALESEKFGVGIVLFKKPVIISSYQPGSLRSIKGSGGLVDEFTIVTTNGYIKILYSSQIAEL